MGALRGRLERGKERLRKRLVRYGLPLAAPALVVGAPPPVSAALVARTVEVVVGGANAVSPALSRLLTTTGRFRSALLLAPAAAMLAAIGVVLAASGGPATDPPKAEPPRRAKSHRIGPAPRTDRFGDPLPDGVVMRLGTIRSRASIAAFGIAADGTVVTASTAAEVSIWPPRSERPTETIRLTDLKTSRSWTKVAVSPDGRFVAIHDNTQVMVWERKGNEFQKRMSEATGEVFCLCFSPDGTKLAVGTTILDLSTAKTFHLGVEDKAARRFEAFAFSGDSKRLAATTGYECAVGFEDRRNARQLQDWPPSLQRHLT